MTAPTEQIKSAMEIKVSPEEAPPSDASASVAGEAPLPNIALTESVAEAVTLPVFGSEFETLSCIGSDDYGQLYRVRNVQMDKEFAIRFIGAEQFADEQAKKSFLRFCRRSVTVTNPALIPIYSFNESQDGISMVTELQPGPSLQELIDSAEFKGAGRVLDVFEQLIDCLEALHQVGIRFGATDPSSIIVSQSAQGSRLVLRDWWASALVQSQKSMANSPVLGYASPEQLQDTGKLDARSDIYGFGAILYEALAGRVPYADNNPVKLAIKILNGEIAPVEGQLASSPVTKIAFVCLNKDPDKRYQSLDDLRADFKAAARGSALPSDKRVKGESWAKRHPTRLTLIILTLVAFLLNIIISLDFGNYVPPLDPVSEALEAEERGDLAGAETILQGAVAFHPADAEQWCNLGRVQLKNKEYRKAESSLKQAISLDPNDSSAFGILGELHFTLGQLPECIESYKKALALDDGEASFYSGLAFAYIHQGDTADAISTAKALVNLDPEDVSGHFTLGFAYHDAKAYAEAATEYEKVISMDPRSAEAYTNLSLVYSHLHENDKAITAAQQAVNLAPADSNFWTNLAHAYLRAGKLTDAEKFYRKALFIDPTHGDALSGLSETLRKSGKKAEAKEYMRRLLD